MTSARLSPAANLLRNSKLFALPPAVPLPPTRPSSEPVHASDTATTIHPTKAAIYTDTKSLLSGDWGLKRPLPTKAFAKTTTPVIRLRSDVDTQEHIADFDSAADHVMTLYKWETHPLLMSNGGSSKSSAAKKSVFRPEYDNTTPTTVRAAPAARAPSGALAFQGWDDSARQRFLNPVAGPYDTVEATMPEAKADSRQTSIEEMLEQYRKDFATEAEASGRITSQPSGLPRSVEKRERWRYQGPWLAAMTNGDFEIFLNQLDAGKTAAFREHLKRGIVARRKKQHSEAVEEARANAVEPPAMPSEEVSEDEVTALLRELRTKTDLFSSEISSFLDLPSPPRLTTGDASWKRPVDEDTSISLYQKEGPPRLHPSAGFSYLRSDRFARMSPHNGPQDAKSRVPARQLKEVTGEDKRNMESGQTHFWGVGGFSVSTRYSSTNVQAWRTTNGGPKTVAIVDEALVSSNGSIDMQTRILNYSRLDQNNVPALQRDTEDRDPQRNHSDELRRNNGRVYKPPPSGYMRTPDLSVGGAAGAGITSDLGYAPSDNNAPLGRRPLSRT